MKNAGLKRSKRILRWSQVAERIPLSKSNEWINSRIITTSEIKITVVIDRRYIELAVRALHSAFELAKDDKKA